MTNNTPIHLFFSYESVFSNFHQSAFMHEGVWFHSSEQAVMYKKAKLFGADNIAELILNTSHPKGCKQLGRSKAIAFQEDVWKLHREKIYYDVLIDKFAVPKMRQALLKTENQWLAEASPYDKIWGIGLASSHVDAMNPDKWPGQNLLGKVLMNVRSFYQTPTLSSLPPETLGKGMTLKELRTLCQYIDTHHSFRRSMGKRIKYISPTIDMRRAEIFHINLRLSGEGLDFAIVNENKQKDLLQWIHAWLDHGTWESSNVPFEEIEKNKKKKRGQEDE